MNGKQIEDGIKSKHGLKLYRDKAKRHLLKVSGTATLSKLAESTSQCVSGVSKFLSVDYDNLTTDGILTITSGVLDIAGAVSSLLPPPASLIVSSVTQIFNMFLPGPPPQPSTTEVISNLTSEIKSGFLEQQSFITKAFLEQKKFISSEFEKFDKLFEFTDKIFSKEFILEMHINALSLLNQVQEQYDYILPYANQVLSEAEALDLDQHVASMDSTFQASRVRYAFIERCPQWFREDAYEMDFTGEVIWKAKKICALLLQAHTEVEKFREITLSQLIIILNKSPLKELTEGYLIINEDRKTDMKTFLSNYVSKDKNLLCHIFLPCKVRYECPWATESQRRSVTDYITFVSPEAGDVFRNIYTECTINDQANYILQSSKTIARGWKIDVTFGRWSSDEIKAKAEVCLPSWYGWSEGAKESKISTKLFSMKNYKTDKKCGRIEFGDCGNDTDTSTFPHNVAAYFHGKPIGVASNDNPTQIVEFPIDQDGELALNESALFFNGEFVKTTTM